MATEAKRTVRTFRRGSRPDHLTVEDVRRVMEPATKNKKAALAFLKSIGVTFTKTGKTKVKPIVYQ